MTDKNLVWKELEEEFRMFDIHEAEEIINNIMDDGRLFYLYDRWQDEKEYEDFADYIEQAKNFIEGFGLVFIKMTKGFKVAIRHIDTLVEIKITKSGANVTYQQQGAKI